MLVLVLAVLTLVASTTTSIARVAALALLLLTISGVVLARWVVWLAALVVVLLKALISSSHLAHELLDDIGDRVHVSGVESAVAIFLEMALEVLLVLVVLILHVAVLFDLVVVHVEGFVVQRQVLLVFGELSLVRSLVTNKGVWALVVLGFEHAAGLNFAVLSEHVSEVCLGSLIETFHVEVASLL